MAVSTHQRDQDSANHCGTDGLRKPAGTGFRGLPRSTASQADTEPAFSEPGLSPIHTVLTLWTDDVHLARLAHHAGVDRIGLDLERHNKTARQPKQLATWISPHRVEQLSELGKVLPASKLFCRIDPIHDGSPEQIEAVLARGATVVMLPMFTTPREVSRFIDLLGGRAHPVLLLEHTDAVDRLEEIVAIPGVKEIHVGLNDLTLSLNKGSASSNRFGTLASDLMTRIADVVTSAGLRFGVGGIGRPGNNNQKIPSDLIYAQYGRLGATAALLARSFFGGESADTVDFRAEIRRARQRLAWWAGRSPEELETARLELKRIAEAATW